MAPTIDDAALDESDSEPTITADKSMTMEAKGDGLSRVRSKGAG